MNIKELEKFREDAARPSVPEIVVSMGTCGIAAGGDTVYSFFRKELEKRGLGTVHLKKTGCLGLCSIEPNVIVKTKDTPAILYGNVTVEVAERILDEHITRNQIVNDFVVAMPSEDIYCER